eukprot:UN03717
MLVLMYQTWYNLLTLHRNNLELASMQLRKHLLVFPPYNLCYLQVISLPQL